MRRALISLGLLALAACATAPEVTLPTTDDLQLPDLRHLPAPALRLFVAGDGGEAGPVHDEVFETIHAIAGATKAPVLLLMPGDLIYPAGLPGACSAALSQLDTLYLSAVPDVPIIAVPGNHDHGDLDLGTRPDLVARDAYFDCGWQSAASAITRWSPEVCPCEPRWHDPTGLTDVGAWTLLRPDKARPGIELIAYDSQAAISDPDRVARAVEKTLDDVPLGTRVLLMAHHPIKSYGPHARSGDSPQDAGSAAYTAYARRFTTLVRAHRAEIALLIFGHDHTLQFLPDQPSELISGAAAKTARVAGAPPEVFAVGESPGFAIVDLLPKGGIDVTLIWRGEPRTFRVTPALRPMQQGLTRAAGSQPRTVTQAGSVTIDATSVAVRSPADSSASSP